MGRHIGEQDVAFDRILASTAMRVRQTLESALPAAEREMPAVEWDDRLYLASVETMMDILRSEAGDPNAILLVGHNPGLQDLLFELIPDKAQDKLFYEAVRKFPTAAFAVLELDIDSWNEISGGCGRMVHFTRPRDLDSTLGPEEVG